MIRSIISKKSRALIVCWLVLAAASALTAAAGLEHPSAFRPEHFSRRSPDRGVLNFADLYPALERGELTSGARDPVWTKLWAMARANNQEA